LHKCDNSNFGPRGIRSIWNGILTQVEEMGLGSVSEKRILITQSEWQSYNCGSMFAYVAHGDFNR